MNNDDGTQRRYEVAADRTFLKVPREEKYVQWEYADPDEFRDFLTDPKGFWEANRRFGLLRDQD